MYKTLKSILMMGENNSNNLQTRHRINIMDTDQICKLTRYRQRVQSVCDDTVNSEVSSKIKFDHIYILYHRSDIL